MSDIQTQGEFILYQTDGGLAQINLHSKDGTVWVTQDDIANLFERSRSTVVEHMQNILSDGELEESSVCRKFRQTASDGKSYDVTHYNLDMILAILSERYEDFDAKRKAQEALGADEADIAELEALEKQLTKGGK